ncbi:MAG: DUF4253 domain-containing protein [Gammaproteobacteria bacterium]|nr:DUF4253 domain-containing protein [Gammaproteobacteria bacterium]
MVNPSKFLPDGRPHHPVNEQRTRDTADAPFEILTLPGADAFETLRALRARRRDIVPVVFGDRDELAATLECIAAADLDYAECRRRGLATQVAEWVLRREHEAPECFEISHRDGDVPHVPEPLSLACEPRSRIPKPEVVIGLVPIGVPWEVLARVWPGGCDETPTPEVHVAFAKHWYERYGAVATAVTVDALEFSVACPPTTLEAALELAHEQLAYCPDVVHEWAGNEENLAVALLNARSWYFWWY